MGISCEISLCRPADGRFIYQPGSIVSGGIRYYLDQEYEFTSITVSLKGIGKMYLEDRAAKTSYTNQERYVDIDNIIHTNEKSKVLPVGQYETQFSFQLPYGIPASLDHTKDTGNHFARCNIKYYVRIKFEMPGRFYINKHYNKDVNVISGQIPRMTTQPLVYGDQKNLLQLSTLLGEKSVVKLKATIANSVLSPEKMVRVDYEIENKTNVDIKRVEVKLLRVDKYTSTGGHVQILRSEVEDTKFTHGAITGGETARFPAEIMVPTSCASIDHSKIISRDYSVLTMVVLPMPHINLPLEIPFQVIARLSSSFGECSASSSTSGYYNDALPTYWEAMGEDRKESSERDEALSAGKLEKERLRTQ